MARILIVIPARKGSKGVPGKNIRVLAGYPLVHYVMATCLAVKQRFEQRQDVQVRVIVSTDSTEVSEIATERGIEVPFMRPDELAGDGVSLIPVAIHAMQFFDAQDWSPDIVCSVQPAAPLTPADAIVRAIDAMIDNSRLGSAVSVGKIHRFHPFRAYALMEDCLKPLTEFTSERYLQKQDRPDAYGFTGGFYCRRRELLSQWSGQDFALGDNIHGEVIAEHRAVDIDSLVDFYLCETILNQIHEFEPA